MLKPPAYKIKAKIWIYSGQGAWHFVTVPKDISTEISKMFGYLKASWGSLQVDVTIGETTWKTSIFPDKKSGCYFIPIKSDIRKNEKINEGDELELELQILV